jgi:transposase-like protein
MTGIECLGYPSRYAAVGALHSMGRSVEEIAEATGLLPARVRTAIKFHEEGRHGSTPGSVQMRIRELARARGVKARDLTIRILDAATKSDKVLRVLLGE